MMRFIFEDGDKGKGDFIWMIDQIVRIERRVLGGVKPIFESKSLAPLQASDLVLWEMNYLSKDQLRNPPEKFSPLRESFAELLKIPRDWGVIDHDNIIKFCVDFGVPKRGEKRVWTGPVKEFLARRGRA